MLFVKIWSHMIDNYVLQIRNQLSVTFTNITTRYYISMTFLLRSVLNLKIIYIHLVTNLHNVIKSLIYIILKC